MESRLGELKDVNIGCDFVVHGNASVTDGDENAFIFRTMNDFDGATTVKSKLMKAINFEFVNFELGNRRFGIEREVCQTTDFPSRLTWHSFVSLFYGFNRD